MIPFVLALTVSAAEPEAEPAVDQVLTLDNVITRAFSEAPAVSSAEANAQVARTRIDIAAAQGLPSLSAFVNGNGNISNGNILWEPPQNSTGPTGGQLASGVNKLQGNSGFNTTDTASAGLQASWLLLDFGRTSNNVRSAQLAANASGSDLETARQQAAAAAGTAFLALNGDLQLVASRQKLVAENERLLEVAHGKVQAGTSAPIEEVRAKVAVETAKVDVLTAEAAAKNDAASLAIALGIDPNRPIKIAPAAPIVVNDDPVQASDLAESTRPEVQALKLRVQSAEAALAAAQAGHLPSLAATGTANIGPRYNYYTGVSLNEIGTLGATFTVPIFDAGVNAEVAAAEAELLVARSNLRQTSVDIRGQAAQAAIAVRSTMAALSAAEQLRIQADENYKEAKGRYELGAASLLELTDAEAQESSATLSLIQASVQSEAAKLRLLVAIGTLRPATTK